MQLGWLVGNLAKLPTSPVTRRASQKQARDNTKRSINSIVRINRTFATCDVQFDGVLQNAWNFHCADCDTQD